MKSQKRFCDLGSGDTVYKVYGVELIEYVMVTPFCSSEDIQHFPGYCSKVKCVSHPAETRLSISKSAFTGMCQKSTSVFSDKELAAKCLDEKLQSLIRRQNLEIDELEKKLHKEVEARDRYYNLLQELRSSLN